MIKLGPPSPISKCSVGPSPSSRQDTQVIGQKAHHPEATRTQGGAHDVERTFTSDPWPPNAPRGTKKLKKLIKLPFFQKIQMVSAHFLRENSPFPGTILTARRQSASTSAPPPGNRLAATSTPLVTGSKELPVSKPLGNVMLNWAQPINKSRFFGGNQFVVSFLERSRVTIKF